MQTKNKYYFLNLILSTLIMLYGIQLRAQNKTIDSLKNALKTAKHDTTRLKLRNEIGEAIPILRIGYWDSISSDAKKLNIKSIEAVAINNIGFICNQQGDIAKALNYYEKSLALREKIGDKAGVAESLSNIGLVYEYQNDLQKAIEYFTKNLKIEEGMGDKKSIANSLNSIGSVFYKQDNHEKALEYFKKSMKMQEELEDKNGVVVSLLNMADIYFNYDSIPRALEYYSRSLNIQRQMNDKQNMANSYNSIGSVYFKQKKYSLALSYVDSALVLSKKLGFPDKLRYTEQVMYRILEVMGNSREAFVHYKQYIIYRDSINNEQTRKASIKNQLKYEFEKKEVLLKEQQERENAVAEEINHRQKIIIWSVAIGLLLVVIFAGYVWRSLKLTHKQKLVIEEKQKEILDSIHYAKRIQTALMTNEKYIERKLTELEN